MSQNARVPQHGKGTSTQLGVKHCFILLRPHIHAQMYDTHIHTYVHTHTLTCIHTHVHARMHTKSCTLAVFIRTITPRSTLGNKKQSRRPCPAPAQLPFLHLQAMGAHPLLRYAACVRVCVVRHVCCVCACVFMRACYTVVYIYISIQSPQTI